MQSASPAKHRPLSVWCVVIGIAVLALELAIITVDGIVQIPALNPANRVATLCLTVLSAVGVVWMCLTARGAWRGDRWSRASAVVAAVLALGIALAAVQPGAVNVLVSVAVGVPAVVVLADVFLRPTTRWFAG